MRIGLLIPELTREGGAERQALSLAAALTEAGHDAPIYTAISDAARCYPDLQRRVDVRPCGRPASTNLPLNGRARAYAEMRRLAASVSGPVDVLNPHGWPAHWAAVLAARRLPGRPPVVWMCNDYLWPPGLLLRPPWWAPARHPRYLARRLTRLYDRSVVHRIDRVAVLDTSMAERVRQGYGVEPIVVRTGVDAERLSAVDGRAIEALRRRLAVGRDTTLLLFVGILMPHRRLEDVLRALAAPAVRAKDVRLLVVGGKGQYPGYARSLEALAQEARVSDRVTWASEVPEADLPLYLHAADAFIFPNENQTWGLAVTEAMASGTPVIVSTGCGVSEVLTDGVTALLVPPRRPDLIAERVAALIDNPQAAAALGREGRRLVRETLSWDRYAQSMLRLFEEALSARYAVPAAGPVTGRREIADA